MKKKRLLFKDVIQPLSIAQFWALSILAPLFFMMITWPTSFHKLSSFLTAFSWYSIIGITQFVGHSYICSWLDQYFPWKEQPIKRSAITIFAIIVYSVIAYIIVATMLALFWYDISLKRAFEIGVNGIWIAVKISGLFALTFTTISFFVNWRKSQIESERLAKEIANYRYQTLKNQVNPHFLFNSLNVLTELVHEDADLSEKYIQQLSKIYRYILESGNHKTVPLSKEIAFIESYIFLLKIRFDDKVNIEMNLDSSSALFTVPIAIQMLIENSVKHNQATTANPLSIRVFEKEQRIFVENNYHPKISSVQSTGVGITNLEQQYKALTDKLIDINQTDDLFTVSLPLFKTNHS